MAQPVTIQFIPSAAREARSALVDALGTENNPAQWMIFMDAVTTHLPDILSSGRPSSAAISRCLIGQHGFNSWKEMIEASNSDNGLGWNFSAWKAWRRAWTVIQEYPWLRNESLTSSEVVQIGIKIKKASANTDFKLPENTTQLSQFLEQEKHDRASEIKQKQEQAAIELATQQKEKADLEAAVTTATSQIEQMTALHEEHTRQSRRLSRTARHRGRLARLAARQLEALAQANRDDRSQHQPVLWVLEPVRKPPVDKPQPARPATPPTRWQQFCAAARRLLAAIWR